MHCAFDRLPHRCRLPQPSGHNRSHNPQPSHNVTATPVRDARRLARLAAALEEAAPAAGTPDKAARAAASLARLRAQAPALRASLAARSQARPMLTSACTNSTARGCQGSRSRAVPQPSWLALLSRL